MVTTDHAPYQVSITQPDKHPLKLQNKHNHDGEWFRFFRHNFRISNVKVNE